MPKTAHPRPRAAAPVGLGSSPPAVVAATATTVPSPSTTSRCSLWSDRVRRLDRHLVWQGVRQQQQTQTPPQHRGSWTLRDVVQTARVTLDEQAAEQRQQRAGSITDPAALSVTIRPESNHDNDVDDDNDNHTRETRTSPVAVTAIYDLDSNNNNTTALTPAETLAAHLLTALHPALYRLDPSEASSNNNNSTNSSNSNNNNNSCTPVRRGDGRCPTALSARTSLPSLPSSSVSSSSTWRVTLLQTDTAAARSATLAQLLLDHDNVASNNTNNKNNNSEEDWMVQALQSVRPPTITTTKTIDAASTQPTSPTPSSSLLRLGPNSATAVLRPGMTLDERVRARAAAADRHHNRHTNHTNTSTSTTDRDALRRLADALWSAAAHPRQRLPHDAPRHGAVSCGSSSSRQTVTTSTTTALPLAPLVAVLRTSLRRQTAASTNVTKRAVVEGILALQARHPDFVRVVDTTTTNNDDTKDNMDVDQKGAWTTRPPSAQAVVQLTVGAYAAVRARLQSPHDDTAAITTPPSPTTNASVVPPTTHRNSILFPPQRLPRQPLARRTSSDGPSTRHNNNNNTPAAGSVATVAVEHRRGPRAVARSSPRKRSHDEDASWSMPPLAQSPATEALTERATN